MDYGPMQMPNSASEMLNQVKKVYDSWFTNKGIKTIVKIWSWDDQNGDEDQITRDPSETLSCCFNFSPCRGECSDSFRLSLILWRKPLVLFQNNRSQCTVYKNKRRQLLMEKSFTTVCGNYHLHIKNRKHATMLLSEDTECYFSIQTHCVSLFHSQKVFHCSTAKKKLDCQNISDN